MLAVVARGLVVHHVLVAPELCFECFFSRLLLLELFLLPRLDVEDRLVLQELLVFVQKGALAQYHVLSQELPHARGVLFEVRVIDVAADQGLPVERLLLSQVRSVLHLKVYEVAVPVVELDEVPQQPAVLLVLLEAQRLHDLLETLVLRAALLAVDGVVREPPRGTVLTPALLRRRHELHRLHLFLFGFRIHFI